MTHEPTSGSEPVPEEEPTPQDSTPPAAPPPPPAASTPPSAPAAPAASSGTSASGANRMDGTQAKAAFSGAHKFDLGLIAAGVVAFIASVLPYYTASVSGGGISASGHASAWHGFFGWFGVLLALVGAGIVVAKILGVALPFPVATVVLGCFAVALLCTILALFISPGGSCPSVNIGGFSCDDGHGFGYWLALLAMLAGTALAFLRYQEPEGRRTSAA